VLPKVPSAALDEVLQPALAGRPQAFFAFLKRNSNLPGPRGNLELAWQLADAVAGLAAGEWSEAAWRVVADLAAVGAAEAPTGDPGEFLAFCGTVSVGAFASDLAWHQAAWEVIRRAAEDERWRLREAAAQAIQRALPAGTAGGLGVLAEWSSSGSWLLCRAAVAGLADPPLLRDPVVAAAALRLHEVVFERFVGAADRKAADFRVLRQGLGYTLSVVVAASPDPGFALMRRLAAQPDPDLRWVLRSNLGKGRLSRTHAREVEAVRALLAG
jgi:hypothetical protein